MRSADRGSLARAHASRHLPRFVQELREFVEIPSVSAEPERKADVQRCAGWLCAMFERIGMSTARVIETPGLPIVYAEWRGASRAPTALLYGHYDVQPARAADGWLTPPFRLTPRGTKVCGRGSSDDKGQVLAHVKALESYLRTSGALPINVKCIIEGEEEIGSPNLERFIRQHKGALAADFAVLSDTPMRGPNAPAITYALRGLLGVELRAAGAPAELHSGNFGGAIANPVHALCEIISRLVGPGGHVTIPGFYDNVRELDAAEGAFMAKHGPSDEEILASARVRTHAGEPGFSLYELTTVRPCLNVTGISGGYTGHGAKAIIPSTARANLDLRLVPNQTAREVEALLRLHLARLAPLGVRVSMRTRVRADPVALPRERRELRAAAGAYESAFGARPAFIRRGGTIPFVELCQRILKTPAVLMGFGLAEDNIHGPNECFERRRLGRAIKTCIEFLQQTCGERA